MKTYEKVLIYIFLFSVIIVCSIVIYKINHDERKLYNEIYAESNEILNTINFENTENDDIEYNEINNTNSDDLTEENNKTSERITTDRINAFLRITKLDIFCPVIKETSMANLKVAPTRLWGGEPNSVGNYCIIGHNLETSEQFSNLKELKLGDTAELMDLSGYSVEYEVYNIYTVNSNDLSFTTQKTDGKREITLVTCTNKDDQRLIVRCKEI